MVEIVYLMLTALFSQTVNVHWNLRHTCFHFSELGFQKYYFGFSQKLDFHYKSKGRLKIHEVPVGSLTVVVGLCALPTVKNQDSLCV